MYRDRHLFAIYRRLAFNLKVDKPRHLFQREVLKGHVVDPGSARSLYPFMARLGRIFV